MVKIGLPKPVKDNAWYRREWERKQSYEEYKIRKALKYAKQRTA